MFCKFIVCWFLRLREWHLIFLFFVCLTTHSLSLFLNILMHTFWCICLFTYFFCSAGNQTGLSHVRHMLSPWAIPSSPGWVTFSWTLSFLLFSPYLSSREKQKWMEKGTLFCWPCAAIVVLARECDGLQCRSDAIMKWCPEILLAWTFPWACWQCNYFKQYLTWQNTSCMKNVDILWVLYSV